MVLRNCFFCAGRKSGKGCFVYDTKAKKGQPRPINQEAVDIFKKNCPTDIPKLEDPSDHDLGLRMVARMVSDTRDCYAHT